MPNAEIDPSAMEANPFQNRPYLDWNLDRWKFLIALVLFIVLVAALLTPSDNGRRDSEPVPTEVIEPGGGVTEVAVDVTPTVALNVTLPATEVGVGAGGDAGSSDGQSTQDQSSSSQAIPSAANASPTTLSTLTPSVTLSQSDTSVAPTAVAPTATLSPTVVAEGTATSPQSNEQEIVPTLGDMPTVGGNFPLTLARLGPNAVVPAQMIESLNGTAPPGSTIEIRARYIPPSPQGESTAMLNDSHLVGRATATEDGLWELVPAQRVAAGQYILTLYRVDRDGGLIAPASPVVVTVLARGEEGPHSLTTPIINYPQVGALLRSGPITFRGSGLPGMRVRLYLNNRMAGETTVGLLEEWQIPLLHNVEPSVYVARVAGLNPQGTIVAESAPVAFTMYNSDIAEISASSRTWPTLPLELTEVAFGDSQRRVLLIRGMATPHSSITAQIDGRPIQFVNAAIDGRWQLQLAHDDWTTAYTGLEVQTNLVNMAVRDILPVGSLTVSPPNAPIFIAPKSGQILNTRRPLLSGLARPASEVSIVVNSTVVARVLADVQGEWAYQVEEPLPPGPVALTAFVETEDAPMDVLSPPILVTIAPQL